MKFRLTNKKFVTTSGIFDFLAILFMCVVVFLVLDSRLGIVLTVLAIIANLFSAIVSPISLKGVNIDMSLKQDIINKGEKIVLEVKVTSGSIFPTPRMAFIAKEAEGLKLLSDKQLCFSVDRFSPFSFTVEYESQIYGKKEIGIEKVLATSYLGALCYNARFLNAENVRLAYVMPVTHDLSFNNELMAESVNVVGGDDNEEDSTAIGDTSRGFPGYEHRKYQPGDPIKRINWKLSAKKGDYYVRLNDAVSLQKQILVLDAVGKSEPLIERERIVEAFASVAQSFLSQMFNVYVYLYDNDTYSALHIERGEDIKDLLKRLCTLEFLDELDNNKRFPPDENIKGSDSVFVFTACAADSLTEAVKPLRDKQINLNIVSVKETEEKNLNAWLVKKDFAIVRQD